MICDRCYGALSIGEHGQYKCPMEPRRTNMYVSGDEIPGGGYHDGQLGQFITHWSQRRQLMAEKGLIDYQYDVEVPEGMAENKQRPSRWGAYRQMDPEHLAWLASKLSTGKAEKVDDDAPLKVTIREWVSE